MIIQKLRDPPIGGLVGTGGDLSPNVLNHGTIPMIQKVGRKGPFLSLCAIVTNIQTDNMQQHHHHGKS